MMMMMIVVVDQGMGGRGFSLFVLFPLSLRFVTLFCLSDGFYSQGGLCRGKGLIGITMFFLAGHAAG